MRRAMMTVGLALSLIAGAGAAQAHERNGAAPAAPSSVGANTHQVRAALTTLTERLVDARAPLTDQLSVAKARQHRLAALIADHPEIVLRHAMPAKARASLPIEAQRYVEEHVTTDGDLEVMHEDWPSGGRYHYFLNRADERLALHFASDAPILQTGDRVSVSGVRVRHAMALQSGTTEVTLRAPVLPNTFGAQKTALILVNFQDQPMDSWLNPAQAREIMFATDNPGSVTNFYKEASYGQTWLEGDVYGVYTAPMNSGSCNWGAIATFADNAAKAEVGAAKMASYGRRVYAFPPSPCGWSGAATIGGSPSKAWINGLYFTTNTISHEMGHNFGLWHSHSLLCDQGHSSICSAGTPVEYGDYFDVMGDAIGAMHFNAVQKDLLGWLNYRDSPPITTVETSGTYPIDPYQSAGTSPKALKVKTPSGDWYYVEYRQALGFDAAKLAHNANVTHGLLVHLWENESANRIFLLNMDTITPEWTYPALEVGSTFSDPESGITISPVWVDGTMRVNISIVGAGSSCVHKNPTMATSPAHQGGKPGTSVSYTVSVTNNDSGCAPSTFNQQASVPLKWAATFAAPTLNISAGVTASTTLTVTSSNAAAVGAYTVSSKSSNAAAPTNAASTTATYDVTNAGTPGTFTDTFNRPDSGTLGNGWTQVSGTFGIQGNRAANASVTDANAVTQPGLVGAIQTIAATFAAGPTSTVPDFGLLARYKDASNYYTCSRRSGGTSVLRISKSVGGVETVLGSAAVPNPARGISFALGCQVQGTTLTLTLNGVVKLTRSDSSFATGSVGMSISKAGGKMAPSWADDFSAIVR